MESQGTINWQVPDVFTYCIHDPPIHLLDACVSIYGKLV